jgi:BNR repeat-like domain
MRSTVNSWLACVAASLCLAMTSLAQSVEILPPALRGATQPQVAVAPNGNIFVTFGKDASVYCTISTNGGKTFLEPNKVATLPKLALGMRRGPRIVASNNRITISAISHSEGNLYAWTSDDAGMTWSKPVTINSVSNSAREGLHAMAGDGQGDVYVAWLDLRNKGTQLWSSASHDGGKTWGGNILVYKSPDGHICECCHPSIFVADSGVVRVMWRNSLKGARDMYVATSTDVGMTFSEARKLGQGTWSLNVCPMDGGGLAGIYSTWRRDKAVYFTDDKPGEHLLHQTGRQPVVAIGKGEPYFLWQKDSQLMLKKGLNSNPITIAENGSFPSIASVSKDQSPIVVWESMTNEVKTILCRVPE